MTVRLLTVVGCLMLAASAVTAGPVMEVSTSQFDFGYVPEHIDVSYVLWLYSRGDSALTITRIDPGCPCLKTDFVGPVTMEPGDSTPVTIRFNSHRFLSQVVKYPVVYNNQGFGTHSLVVSAYVFNELNDPKPLVLKPNAMDISAIGDNPRDSVSFELTNNSEKPVRPKVVYLPPQLERVVLPEVINPGKTERGAVIIKPSALGTDFYKSFTIEVDDRDATRYTVPVRRRQP